MLSWLPWLISGGTIAWIALAIFAPSILQIITPVVTNIINGVAEILKALWQGFLDMADNGYSILFCAVLVLGGYLYGHNSTAYHPRKMTPAYSYSAPLKKLFKPEKKQLDVSPPMNDWFK